ncbi:hypothetical protein Daus18300_003499 [Diaporthe australafricana]|uniref:Zn(2)-C6 fungal-type domain-containing protein n=1 Tax=Diaporthe australafricana TaxID=127596 RepID=A0ABR3XFF2_9PEZI
MSEAPVLKRRRITTACNSCRVKKSKCDGKRPLCGRCSGYGYHCSWGNQAQRQESPVAQFTASATGLDKSQQLLAVYQQLVQSLTPQLPRDTRAEVRNCLATVQARVGALVANDADSSPSSSADTTTVQPIHSRRYLGEISDVHFCNIVKQTAEPDAEARDTTDCVDNYDPEDLATPRHYSHPLMNLPGRAQVEEDLHTYFSTIHFAYPFVSKPSFMAKLETLQSQGVDRRRYSTRTVIPLFPTHYPNWNWTERRYMSSAHEMEPNQDS